MSAHVLVDDRARALVVSRIAPSDTNAVAAVGNARAGTLAYFVTKWHATDSRGAWSIAHAGVVDGGDA